MKKEAVGHFLGSREQARELATLVENKAYEEAYRLVERHPHLQEAPAYQVLESRWEKVFATVKKLLDTDAGAYKHQCRELLQPFLGVRSKRTLAKQLLASTEIFIWTEELVRKKRFRDFFLLAEKHPVVRETALYQKVLSLGEKLHQRIQELKGRERFTEALEALGTLADFIPFQEITVRERREIKAAIQFYEALKNSAYQTAFAILEEHPHFRLLPPYAAAREQLGSTLDKIQTMAFDGNVREVLKGTAPYLQIGYFRERAAAIIKTAYLKEIEGRIAKLEQERRVTVLNGYLALFGDDNEISALTQKLGLGDAMAQTDPEIKDPSGYKEKPFPPTLIPRA